MNIQYGIGKGFVSRERANYMGLYYSFFPIPMNITHASPNYGPGK